jgi:D-beta-D-heptose 7-phosphate kinase/D-beta-D-heptose 1-phosphate adenosyltransferase
MRTPESKILSREAMLGERNKLRGQGKTVVLTNGCFDILHAGHIGTMTFARSQGDVLVAAVNTDRSVRRLKGEKRPLVEEQYRAVMLAALETVDYVVLFDETEVLPLVKELRPDVLVKGQDREGDVVGQAFVESYGGRVAIAPLVPGLSTTTIIERALKAYGSG